MTPTIVSLFNLFLAISLLFSVADASPLHQRIDDIAFAAEPKIASRSHEPSTGRQDGGFDPATKLTEPNIISMRDSTSEAGAEPKRSQAVKRNRLPAMPVSLRVYTGNYWDRKV